MSREVKFVAAKLASDLAPFDGITVTVDSRTDCILITNGTLGFAVTTNVCRDWEYESILAHCQKSVARIIELTPSDATLQDGRFDKLLFCTVSEKREFDSLVELAGSQSVPQSEGQSNLSYDIQGIRAAAIIYLS
jgi:hypothetical protein